MERIEWLDPRGEPIDQQLVTELHRELCPEHCLYGRKVVVLGQRKNQDDVLFRVIDGHQPYAVVHLTWHKESDPDFPWTTFYGNLDEVYQRFRDDNESPTD
jgi:hypothetical protein